MVTEVKIEGLAELDKLLKDFAPRLEANILRASLRAGAVEMAEEVKRRTPYDYGELRKTIRVSTSSRRGRVSARIRAGGTKKVFYGHMVEFGTAAHLIKPKKEGGAMVFRVGGRTIATRKPIQHPGTKAQPFMRPAFDSTVQESLAAFRARVRRGINTEFAKRGRR